MDETFRGFIHEQIIRTINEICEANHGAAEIRIDKGYPCLINDTTMSVKWLEYAQEYLGDGQIVTVPPRMTSEDFAYYSQSIPACFSRLGIGTSSQVHSPDFNPDEASIAYGMGILTWMALRFLGNT